MNDRSKFEAAVHGAVVEARRKAEVDPSPVERYRLDIGEIFVGFALPDKAWYGLDHDEELVRWLKWRGKGSLVLETPFKLVRLGSIRELAAQNRRDRAAHPEGEKDLYAKWRPFGTLWIVSHDERRKFNSQDDFVMSNLTDVCEAALSCGIQEFQTLGVCSWPTYLNKKHKIS